MHSKNCQIIIDILPADMHIIQNYPVENKLYKYWIYLGKDVLLREKIGVIFGERCSLVMLGKELQECASTYRQDYIDYIGHLGQLYRNDQDPCWWLTSLSEKNPYVSDVFLNLCYLSISLAYIRNNPSNLIVVCESPALIQALKINLENEKLDVRSYITTSTIIQKNLNAYLWLILKKGWFFGRYIMRVILARLFAWMTRSRRVKNGSLEFTIIHSWTDERSFSESTHYTDVYCGELGRELERRGENVIYLANILPTMNYWRAVQKLMPTEDNVVLLEEYISISDIVRTLFITGRMKRSIANIPDFLGMDVTDLIVSALQDDHLNTRAEQSLLSYYGSKRMGDCYQISTFIYTFENHIHEKMLCLGLRKSTPDTIITGYAHSVVIPMYTSYSVSASEKNHIPLPDRMVVNGKRPRDVLVASGFDMNSVSIGGAVRYASIFKIKTQDLDQTRRNHHTILVTPTSGILETVELVSKILSAFEHESAIEVLIKPHPILPIDRLKSALPLLPSHIRLDERSIDELLADSSILIYTETTVSIEALARGIPVLHVASDVRIDMNPLEGYDSAPSVSRPEDIRTFVYRLISMGDRWKERYSEIASEFFEDVHDDYLEIFLGTHGE